MPNLDQGFVRQPDGKWLTEKAPGDALYYGRSILKRFPGRTIAAASVVASTGVTVGAAGHDDYNASVLVSGGTVGQQGSVTLRCQLDDGQISDRTLWFDVVAK